jgi:nicotinamidase-related amidase
MAISKLDPKTALVVIDLQKGIVTRPTAHPAAEIVAKSAKLAAAARKAGLPVVLVHVGGGAPGRTDQKMSMADLPADWTELVPELNRQPSDHVVMKRTFGAFTNTDLESYLRSNGVTQIVLCGISTSIGVESTARFAHELGFHVAIAVDATTDMNADAYHNSVARIFPRLAETGTADEIIALMGKHG